MCSRCALLRDPQQERLFPQGAFQLGGDMPGDVTLSVNERAVYLRGYPAAEFRGENAALLSLEYRLPIVNIERGGGQTPFFWRRLHGAVFAEAGNAWDSGASMARTPSGQWARTQAGHGFCLRLGSAHTPAGCCKGAGRRGRIAAHPERVDAAGVVRN